MSPSYPLLMRSLVFILALGACQTQPAPTTGSAVPTASAAPIVHRFHNNWGNGAGCEPFGAELTVRGVIEVRPFGKGSDGVLIKTATDAWVVSYRADNTLLKLQDREVEARGRACRKNGEAVGGKHFDLVSITE